MNLSCPRCKKALATVKAAAAVSWRCPTCRGAAIGVGLLRRLSPQGRAEAIWRTAWDPSAGDGVPCPSCTKATRRFTIENDLVLQACRPCLVVWFDGDELRRFAPERQESSQTPSTMHRARDRALAVAAAVGADMKHAAKLQDAAATKARAERKRRTGSLDALIAALLS